MCGTCDTQGSHPDGSATTVEIADATAYPVKGMTCEHCAMSVTEEVEQVSGVTGIEVDLTGGRIFVRGEGFSDAAIAAAVHDAGYELVSA